MTHSPRPSVTQWLGYVVGRPMPPELREWVRRDLTGPGAGLRHMLRGGLVYLPVVVVLALFPGPLWLRGLMVLMALLLSTFYIVAFMDQNRHRRLEVNGLPTDLVSAHEQHVRDRDRTTYEDTYRSS